MRGATKLPLKETFKQVYPMRDLRRCMTSSVPNYHEKSELKEAGLLNNNAEPVAAFSRPPPMPPIFGPLVLLSLLEMGSGSDGNDN